MNKMLSTVGLMLVVAVSAYAESAKPVKPGAGEYDLWFSVLMQDQPAGWLHRVLRREGENWVSSEEMSLSVGRGPVAITISIESRFVETADGRPVSAKSTQTLGRMPTVAEMTFTPDGIDLVTTQAGQTQKSKLPLPKGEWLTPAKASRYSDEQFRAGAKEIKYRTASAENHMATHDVVVKIGEKKNVEVMGKTVRATEAKMTDSLMPGTVATSYVDEQAMDVRAEVELMPGMKLTMLRADKDLAKAKINPPDLVGVMLLKPDKAIENPRKTRRGVYELTIKREKGADAPKIELPNGGVQGVAWADGGGGGDGGSTATVTVDVDAPADPKDQPTDADRAACSKADANDEVVKGLAAKALKGHENETPARKAEALRKFVHTFIKSKDLSVGFATASETARTAEGDCTEHAVLLAALLRTQGIPSRGVSGLVYADQFGGMEHIFGYHMWTRAFLPDAKNPAGRWVDLDATLPGPAFDATHIALGVTNLSEADDTNDMIKLAGVIGRVGIKVVEVK